MNKSVTFIVRSFLDYDRPTQTVTRHWVKARIRLYHELTLKSILNQSFQDFRILVLCGLRHKETTQYAKWHPRLEICHDGGRAIYESLDTDYLSITRIDSDDLMHRDAMAEVSDNQILTNKRECLVFQKCLLWNMPNRYLSRHDRSSPPTYTHIFPKMIYKDWPEFYSQNFVSHGRAGGKLPTSGKLSADKICIVKHWLGNNRIRHGSKIEILSEAERQQLAADYPFVILEREKIKNMLKDFAVEEKWTKWM